MYTIDWFIPFASFVLSSWERASERICLRDEMRMRRSCAFHFAHISSHFRFIIMISLPEQMFYNTSRFCQQLLKSAKKKTKKKNKVQMRTQRKEKKRKTNNFHRRLKDGYVWCQEYQASNEEIYYCLRLLFSWITK